MTYEIPSIHPSFAIPTKPEGGNHTIGFTEAARTEEAHEATLRVAKGLALVGFRVINDEKFFYKVSLITSVFTSTSLTLVYDAISMCLGQGFLPPQQVIRANLKPTQCRMEEVRSSPSFDLTLYLEGFGLFSPSAN